MPPPPPSQPAAGLKEGRTSVAATRVPGPGGVPSPAQETPPGKSDVPNSAVRSAEALPLPTQPASIMSATLNVSVQGASASKTPAEASPSSTEQPSLLSTQEILVASAASQLGSGEECTRSSGVDAKITTAENGAGIDHIIIGADIAKANIVSPAHQQHDDQNQQELVAHGNNKVPGTAGVDHPVVQTTPEC